ncbi:MAG: acetyl/propionyl/methylcrotonyl-CoA carboxylase subunit alpha [Alphaproteobacteria bacterium]|nr:acetyl/propionyl/methylcrotonyl-CoA carboxylase subunit alpha [Alphaproteobacteria bacterium]
MFRKILIANRGEIACRVIRTCRKLGIRNVAVYSEADDGAQHMRLADEAIAIGKAPAAESYLVIEKIIEACERSGADAVHPGYGFLSENRRFAEALEKKGITFIGPSVHAVHAMGDKIESKKLAKAAGVNTIPGYLGAISGPDEAAKIAAEIGYPVMIKASAGGGGKGMRLAWNEGECREGFVSATSEARSSFGDERVFIEKFIQEPRHIEIQVLGDRHGNIVYLGERECSIQRRHQKVIEEAPSPLIDAATRKAMGEQAVALAREVGYFSAGTVEMVVGPDKSFYFLEMNTRLQVEHPVTELVTGIDLVEMMIRVAAGEKLPFTQEQIELNGWAMESRIYAEDPYRGFLPSTGRLQRYRMPQEGRHVRIDTGVTEGSEISLYYDPMIAKLCTWGRDRNEAIRHMRGALDATEIDGISHNVNFLAAVAGHPRFQAGRLSTAFIAEEFPDGFQGAALPEAERNAVLSVAVFAHLESEARARRISGQMPGYRPEAVGELVLFVGDDRHVAQVQPAVDGIDVTIGDHIIPVRSHWRPGARRFEGVVQNQPFSALIRPRPEGFRITHGGADLDILVRTPRAAELARHMPVKLPPDTSKFLLCPMPGLVVSIAVSEGEQVKAGQPLAVVEAMKMENVLRAERDGTVAKVAARPGDSLAVDQVILEFA